MIGSLLAMGGSIAMAMAAGKNNNKAYRYGKRELAKDEAETKARYERFRNADFTQLAQNRAALTEGLQNLRRQNQAAMGRNTMMGGTQASVAAEKERNNQAYANMVRGVAAQGTQYAQHLDDNYDRARAGILQGKLGLEQQRAAGKAAALNTAAGSVQQAGKAFDNMEDRVVEAMIAKNTGK